MVGRSKYQYSFSKGLLDVKLVGQSWGLQYTWTPDIQNSVLYSTNLSNSVEADIFIPLLHGLPNELQPCLFLSFPEPVQSPVTRV